VIRAKRKKYRTPLGNRTARREVYLTPLGRESSTSLEVYLKKRRNGVVLNKKIKGVWGVNPNKGPIREKRGGNANSRPEEGGGRGGGQIWDCRFKRKGAQFKKPDLSGKGVHEKKNELRLVQKKKKSAPTFARSHEREKHTSSEEKEYARRSVGKNLPTGGKRKGSGRNRRKGNRTNSSAHVRV